MQRTIRLAVGALCVASCAVATSSAAHAQGAAGAAPGTAASKFYLDYNVPESPAFAVLGATPSNVLRGTASKPLAISLLTQAAKGSSLASGVAFDVAPYAYVGRFRNVAEYQGSTLKRILSNVLVSLATVEAPGDVNSVAFASGLRVTLWDDHDLLANSSLSDLVSRLLVPKKIDCPKIPGTNICQTGTSTVELPVDLSSAYATARDSVLQRRGVAAAIGGALGGTLRGGVARSDSLKQRTGRGWLAVTGYLGRGQELLATAEYVSDTSSTKRFLGGVAYRLQSTNSALAAELAYDSKSGDWLPGVNAELRLLSRVSLVAALVTDAPSGAQDKSRLRFRTAVRWAGVEGF